MSIVGRLGRIARVVTGVGLGCNVGLAGRALRGVAGLALLGAFVATWTGATTLGAGLGVGSVVGAGYLLWEAATGYCPVQYVADAAAPDAAGDEE
ncbi:MAG: YgaP-like transmembrane domain [Halolamina sp.]